MENEKFQTLNKNLTFIDFCAGIGGGRIPFENLGFKCLGFSEIDKNAEKTYRLFFGENEKNYGDLTKINTDKLPNFDIMVGGFPCQTFSVIGQRKGMKDKRGEIIFHLIKIMKEKNIKFFLLENVKGLVNHDNGKSLEIILEAFDEAGYCTEYKILNSINYGVPQMREIIYFVGTRKDLLKDDAKFSFPNSDKQIANVEDFLIDDNEIAFNDKQEAYKTFIKYLNNKYNQNKYSIKKLLKNEYLVLDTRQSDLRLYYNKIPTLRLGRHGILYVKNKKFRKLSGYESLLLQGFPKELALKAKNNIADAYILKQAGNAMTVNTIQAIAEKIFEFTDFLWKINYFKLIVILIFCFFSISISFAQEQSNDSFSQKTYEGYVNKILEEKEVPSLQSNDKTQPYQKLEIIIISGDLKNKHIVIDYTMPTIGNIQKYFVGDNLMLALYENKGNDSFIITGYSRKTPLLWLAIIFILSVFAIAKFRAIQSFLAMGFSFIVIFFFMLPQLLAGANPVETAVAGSLIIIPITFFLSHGLNKKTIIATIGTFIALVFTGILANVFIEACRLTGFASEESGFLQMAKHGAINMKGILLAGIIIGSLGVLDDITIAQASLVFELKDTDKALSFKDLYKKAMHIGQDHIASMINTLVLVYTGASLPLLLLFINNPHPILEVINYEIISDEIVRTLVGSTGLIIAVPITTLIASFIADYKEK